MKESNWSPSSWSTKDALQQPQWPDELALHAVIDELRGAPPLVFPHEVRRLAVLLGDVCAGEAFVLQAGDCAESLDAFTAENVRNKLKVILQMAAVFQYASGVPVIKIGRMAGQFAKPRSDATETRDGVTLPVFRGHMVNDIAFDAASRTPDPGRILRVYEQSAATLTLLRAFTTGGFADLREVHSWSQEFLRRSPQGHRYEQVARGVDASLAFMASCGISADTHPEISEVEFYTSHEALLLGYEEALTRRDSLTGKWYDCSAHMLWVGERTRGTGDAHVEFLSGVANPVGCKLGPSATPADAEALCERLNPERIPGQLTLISRMGAGRVLDALPPIVEHVERLGHPVVWVCDPMHGNTYTSTTGRKTRDFEDVVTEIEGFFAVHHEIGSHPGGLHVELTGDDVTECVGGSERVDEVDLSENYETMCDPRLNASQSLDLAFRVTELLSNPTTH